MSNNPARKLTVGVIFGSRSVEHDVSVVTAQQVIKALNPDKYEVVPIYITREGAWLTGAALSELATFKNEAIAEQIGIRATTFSPTTDMPGLITPPLSGLLGRSTLKRLDVVFPAVHGSHGEDGTLQGLLEMADVAYVGAGVAASAVANDKVLTKGLLRANGLAVVDFVAFSRHEWLTDRERLLKRIEETLTYPLFIKPATLGSSIGVAKVANGEEAIRSIQIALNFDRRVLVESAVVGAVEINCAVLGNDTIRPSVLEQPVTYEQFLNFDAKYLHGSGGMKSQERIIPAPLDAALSAHIRQTAVDAFRAVGGQGTARIDFLLKDETVYVNEINTMPGSLAFYLWAAENMSPAQVCDELIRLALEAHKEKRKTTYNYKSRLIAQASSRGLKGMKK